MCVREEDGGERHMFPGEGVLRYAVRKVSPSVSGPLVLRSKTFSDPSSVVSIDATDHVTLTTVGRVKILAESHGSYGKSNLGFLTNHLLIITTAILLFILVQICVTLQALARRPNLALQR